MITANILTDSFLMTLGAISAIVVWVLIIIIIAALIALICGEKTKEDKKDKFDWSYQDEKCFYFDYYTNDSHKQVLISKDKLKSLIEDKNIDLYYSEESK